MRLTSFGNVTVNHKQMVMLEQIILKYFDELCKYHPFPFP